jgi:hypothetical protein
MVLKSEIEIGAEYALREPPKRGVEIQRVRVLEQTRSQWKVEWVEPNRGLVDYVKSMNLVSPWRERRAFLREEENWAQLKEACSNWPGHVHPIKRAIDLVLAATGEISVWIDNKGALSGSSDAFERLSTRASFSFPTQLPSFVDRRDEQHHPFSVGLDFARAFAKAEPKTVLLEVESEERSMEVEARESGNAHLVPLVQEYRAQWALCRQWAGFDQALAERDAEIERLRRIITDLRYDLVRQDRYELADKLDRKLRGR